MAAALIVLSCFCIWLSVRHVRGILAIRSLNRQLAELERGSHMELGGLNRRKDILDLVRELNRLEQFWFRNQMQHEKAEKKLKQNIIPWGRPCR